jgi:hypothetical protein
VLGPDDAVIILAGMKYRFLARDTWPAEVEAAWGAGSSANREIREREVLCVAHGGTDARIGAPPGNTNALTHKAAATEARGSDDPL